MILTLNDYISDYISKWLWCEIYYLFRINLKIGSQRIEQIYGKISFHSHDNKWLRSMALTIDIVWIIIIIHRKHTKKWK